MKKDTAHTLIRPRITEKATLKAESGVYVFEISKESNKGDVSRAIKEIYKVTPIKVSVVNISPKNVFIRGKKGMKSGYKKAYVYLKKGDTIEVI